MMTDFSSLGRMMMVVGALFFLVGLFCSGALRFPIWAAFPATYSFNARASASTSLW